MFLLHLIGFCSLCFHYHLSLCIFLISSLISSVIHWLFSSILISLYMFVFFEDFSCNFYSHSTVFGKDVWYNFSFFSLLRTVLWPSMWSILQNVPYALEKNVYSASFGWNVLYISIKPIWSNVSFKDIVSLWILSEWSVHWCKWQVKEALYYYCVTVNFYFYSC